MSPSLPVALRAARHQIQRTGRISNPLRAVTSVRETTDGVTRVDLAIEQAGASLESLRAAGFNHVSQTSGRWVFGFAQLSDLDGIAAVPGIGRVQAAQPVTPTLDLSVPIQSLPEIGSIGVEMDGPQGQGVVVGFVDSGVDFEHPDFTDPVTGRTRITHIWDQTDCWNSAPPTGGSTGTFACNDTTSCGTEYTAKDIDCALGVGSCSGAKTVNQTDTMGHGTHVAGTAAGSGASPSDAGPYRGVASKAEIIMVTFDFPNYCYRNSTLSIVEGVRYVFERAAERGLPAVVNLSLGQTYGPHSGDTALDQALSDLTGPGKVIVAAAGNDGRNGHPDNVGAFGNPIHGSGTLTAGATAVFTFDVPDSGGFYWGGGWLSFDVWYAHGVPASASVTVTSPVGGTITGPPGTDKCSGINGGQVCIYNTAPDPYFETMGIDNELWIEVSDSWTSLMEPGTWTVELDGVQVPGGSQPFDVWMQASPSLALVDANYPDGPANNLLTVGSPAVADDIIAAAATTTRNQWVDSSGQVQGYGLAGSALSYTGPMPVNELAFFSSRGPRRGDDLQKPDVAAPGAGIAAALSQDAYYGWYGGIDPARVIEGGPGGDGLGGYAVLEGTSMASPHVAGAVGLLLSLDGGLSPADVRDVLAGSSVDLGSPGPDSHYGFGRLHVAEALSIVQAACATKVEVCDYADNDCDGEIDEGLENLCGGCQPLPVDPGAPCGACGTVVCAGLDAVSCDAADENLCGFCGPAPEEVCNGQDDDCDGQTDEHLGTTTCGVGACLQTVPLCQGGALVDCEPAEPQVEVCGNGVDEDCDGDVDESGYNLCGGCDVLEAQPNDPCGSCGFFVCDGPDGVRCVDAGPNACGDCGPVPEELCNDLDDDCDGQTDEGFDTVGDGGSNGCGGCLPLDSAPGAPCGVCGTMVCVAANALECVDVGLNACGDCGPLPAEACNGVDDDCDGQTDNGLGTTTCGKSDCQQTVENCVDGAVQLCSPLPRTQEVCGDGIDNDCDGATDEEGVNACGGCAELTAVPGGACGECGVWECEGTEGLSCADPGLNACGDCGPAPQEVCNDQDDDCDGATDEDLGTITCGKSDCSNTVAACVGGQPQTCKPLPRSEDVCGDGIDNDCDGETDEEGVNGCGGCTVLDLHPGEPCGVCMAGVLSCNGTDQVVCDDPGTNACGECGPPVVDTCNGVDDDCDGTTDEDAPVVSCGVGACAVTVSACVDGEPSAACTPAPAGSEVCYDGIDGDCDGVMDQACELIPCSQEQLAVLHATWKPSKMEIDVEVLAPESAEPVLLLDGLPPQYSMSFKKSGGYWKARYGNLPMTPTIVRIEAQPLVCFVESEPVTVE